MSPILVLFSTPGWFSGKYSSPLSRSNAKWRASEHLTSRLVAVVEQSEGDQDEQARRLRNAFGHSHCMVQYGLKPTGRHHSARALIDSTNRHPFDQSSAPVAHPTAMLGRHLDYAPTASSLTPASSNGLRRTFLFDFVHRVPASLFLFAYPALKVRHRFPLHLLCQTSR